MPRTTRKPSEYDWHHVLNRGVDRSAVFFDDRDRVDFLDVLADACERSSAEVHAYCLMTNHYHLLIRAPLTSLAEAMHRFGTTYTRHVNDRWDRDGPLFRGRFQSVPIGDDRQLLQCFRYIHRNPTAIVGAGALDSYRWSSHRCYLGHRSVPAWLRTDELLTRFDGAVDYRSFIAEGHPRTDLSLDDVRHTVVALACEYDGIRAGGPLIRAVVMLVSERHPAIAGHLTARLTFSSDNARYAAQSRARLRLRTDDEFRQLFRRVETTLQLGSDPE